MVKKKLREISTDELKKILDAHLLWLESGKEKGKRANLYLTNLKQAKFSRVNLEGANLKGTDLRWAILTGANLAKAILQEASLYKANLEGANLTRANLVKAYLSGAELTGAYLEETDLAGANLTGANLSVVNLLRANLKGADLSKAKLWNANLERTNLERAKLRRSNLKEANLMGASLVKANLENAELEGVDLRDADLSDTVLEGANLCQVKTAGVNFKGTNLNRIRIDIETVKLLPQEVVNLYGKSFIILGYKNDLNKIIRSIEFPPEYHQAGISILNFFSNVLETNYPEKTAKFRIEQEEKKVTMIIETEEGDKEIIEKSLDDYGLVITGQMTPEQFTDNRQLLMELKIELRVAQATGIRDRYLLIDIEEFTCHIWKKTRR